MRGRRDWQIVPEGKMVGELLLLQLRLPRQTEKDSRHALQRRMSWREQHALALNADPIVSGYGWPLARGQAAAKKV